VDSDFDGITPVGLNHRLWNVSLVSSGAGSVEISNGGAGLDGDLFHNENLPKGARENESVLEMKLE
jgi:hypothetical protein